MVLLGVSGGGERAQAASTSDLEGQAWIMDGLAYNTQQPVNGPDPSLHLVKLPPGGTNDEALYYNFNDSAQLILSAQSSHVTCNSSGNTPGSSSAHSLCQVVLEGFQLWVGPYQIIGAARISVTSSSSWSNAKSTSFPSVAIDGLCVYIEFDYANGCRVIGPGESVTFDRPPISGTVSRPLPEQLVTNGDQLGAGSSATALHVDLFNADYTTSTGIADVILDIAHAESFAGQPDWTPTPTRTPTPTKTPTPQGGESFKALLPGLSRDQ